MKDRTAIALDLERVEASFKAIAKLRSRFVQEFHLVRIADYHSIPKATFKRLFELWKAEQATKVLNFPGDGNGGAA